MRGQIENPIVKRDVSERSLLKRLGKQLTIRKNQKSAKDSTSNGSSASFSNQSCASSYQHRSEDSIDYGVGSCFEEGDINRSRRSSLSSSCSTSSTITASSSSAVAPPRPSQPPSHSGSRRPPPRPSRPSKQLSAISVSSQANDGELGITTCTPDELMRICKEDLQLSWIPNQDEARVIIGSCGLVDPSEGGDLDRAALQEDLDLMILIKGVAGITRVLRRAEETRKRARPFFPEQWFEEREVGKKAEFERQKTIARLRVKLMHSPLLRV